MRCISEVSVSNARYLDYKIPNVYEHCKFKYVEMFDGFLTYRFDHTNLTEIKQLFIKENSIVSYNAYANFSLLFYELHKLKAKSCLDQPDEEDINIENVSTCCVRDLHFVLNKKIKDEKYFSECLKNTRDAYISLCKTIKPENFLGIHNKCWIEYGKRPVVNKVSGKWLIFTPKMNVQKLYNLLIANEKSLNFAYVKASTMAVNIWGGRPQIGVVMVHYDGLNNKSVLKLGHHIKEIIAPHNFASKITCKTDFQSMKGSSLNGVKKNTTFTITVSKPADNRSDKKTITKK